MSSNHREDNYRRNQLAPSCLVSVQDKAEFEMVVRAGVEIVDLKNPSLGPLSPTSINIWNEIAASSSHWQDQKNSRAIQGKPMLSAALGEFHEAHEVASSLPPSFHFAKAGPSQCQQCDRLVNHWEELRGRLHDQIELVAVAYADWRLAEAIDPLTIFESAAENGFRHCLLDTFTKDGRSSLDFLSMDQLKELRSLCQRKGMWFAMAGSITELEISKLIQFDFVPDCYAVRGAVCRGERSEVICADRLQSWQEFLLSCSSSSA